MSPPPLGLFDAYGVELEYMIVDAETLSIKPIADRLLEAVAGEITSEVEQGEISWSNELALHVVELKTTRPAGSLEPVPALFQASVDRINELLWPLGARLLPTAMHPWMNPDKELKLWPHDYSEFYKTFDRIFDCRGHGWANLQSVHLNLPFADDAQFGPLHAAVRLLLPIMPALAASSPIVERRVTGLLDSRLDAYRTNAQSVPSVTGLVVPEPVFTRHDYEQTILEPMYRAMEPLDPEGILRHEWCNARGAIARFERNTIEVRVLDMQEQPLADVAICAAVSRTLRAMIDGRWTGRTEQRSLPTETLAGILDEVIRDGERAVIRDRVFLAQFGVAATAVEAGALWSGLIEQLIDRSSTWRAPLETILTAGPLARRILRALGDDPADRLLPVYRRLAECLAEGTLFDPSALK